MVTMNDSDATRRSAHHEVKERIGREALVAHVRELRDESYLFLS
jgi:hypothetical protein